MFLDPFVNYFLSEIHNSKMNCWEILCNTKLQSDEKCDTVRMHCLLFSSCTSFFTSELSSRLRRCQRIIRQNIKDKMFKSNLTPNDLNKLQARTCSCSWHVQKYIFPIKFRALHSPNQYCCNFPYF